MGTSSTSQSALLSGAAKDDAVGLNGDFTFTIADLLGNDPGGAAKVDVTKQFFFGATAADQANQSAYLTAHGITDNGDGTYTIGAGATDFKYFVQIGNKGTWSQADVDVTAPVPVQPHKGDLLFEETFDNYQILQDHVDWGSVDLSSRADHQWATTPNGWGGGWGQAFGEIVKSEAFEGSMKASSGNYWLDTQNSPGGIDITNWFHDDTGGAFVLSFDLGTHDYGTGPLEETAHDGTFEVRIDGGKYVKTFNYSDFATNDVMQHFELLIDVGDGDAAGNHNITFVDTTASQGNYVGFALDTIQVYDWVI